MASTNPSRPRNGQAHATRSIPAFPTRQMLVLAICRICEPIAFMGIFPYIYQMVRDFHITEDQGKISFYAGLVTSVFTFAEFSTGFLWGRLSDRVGRKPVLLTGLIGTALSVLIFGFAPNLTVALIARAVGGLLNGNMGVLQSTVAELVTVQEHQARAYTIMPLVWCIGSIVGPMIGGALARPCEIFPTIFVPGSIWDKYPYLLPNLFSAFVVLIGVINGLLFLEETHIARRGQRDRGLELGNWILSKLGVLAKRDNDDVALDSTGDEREALLSGGSETGNYRTTNESTTATKTTAQSEEKAADRISKIFTRTVILNIVSFGILAFHTMTFDSLFPIFLSTEPPAHRQPISLPFKFVDGFGFDTKTNGMILSAQGVYSLIVNMWLVPFVVRRFGARRLFRFLALGYFALYIVTPYLVLLPGRFRLVGIAFILIWKCTFASMAYPSNAILTANSAPSNLALGTINGAAASTASLCRAFGPTVSGMLYSVGLQTGYIGLAWWCSAIVAIGGGLVSLHIEDKRGRGTEKFVDDVEAAPPQTAAP